MHSHARHRELADGGGALRGIDAASALALPGAALLSAPAFAAKPSVFATDRFRTLFKLLTVMPYLAPLYVVSSTDACLDMKSLWHVVQPVHQPPGSGSVECLKQSACTVSMLYDSTTHNKPNT